MSVAYTPFGMVGGRPPGSARFRWVKEPISQEPAQPGYASRNDGKLHAHLEAGTEINPYFRILVP